jgi:uncharacterized protein (TIGR00251 family)
MFLTVKVTPNASRNQIDKWIENVLYIKITAVPEKGKANEAVIVFLSKILNISKSRIELVSGATSRIKRLKIDDLSLEELELKILPMMKKNRCHS